MSKLENVIRPGPSRGLDPINLDELRKKTGVNQHEVLKFALSEMLCNSLDKDDVTEIGVNVEADEKFQRLSVNDNGTKKITGQELEKILDFETKASSKRGFLRVSRGYLGNALKCIIGYSFALTENKGLSPSPVTVESDGYQYKINLKPDRIREVINHEIETAEIQDNGLTTFTVTFPRDEMDSPEQLKDVIFASHMVNPDRQFTFNVFGERGRMEAAGNGKPIRRETSVLWYTEEQFTDLFKDYVRTTPDTTLVDFMALFRGFTGKKIIREKLTELNAATHDLKTINYEFLPSTTIQELSLPQTRVLFYVMRQGSKTIAKQSISSVLGMVGKEKFESVCKANSWKRLRHCIMSGASVASPEVGLYRVEAPYVIELAVFDRKEDDADGLKVYQCVNFMVSPDDLFSKTYSIGSHLGYVGITRNTPVTVVIHFVCPALNWLNYGKSSLDVSRIIQEDMEKIFKKVLPIPKTPRKYYYSPPFKPLSWVPHGKVGDESYENRLIDFANEIKAIDSQRTKKVKYSSRGWCYLLEGLQKINKGEFNACQKAINDCRKTGLLPIDFIAEDQDVTRRLSGFVGAYNPADLLSRAKHEAESLLRSLASLTTDYWAGEKYYVMMVVEKGDLRNLFEPICDEYNVPIASSKGWSPINLRYHIAVLAKKAESRGLTPVLLLFYDHDPAGIKITKIFRKNLADCERGTEWNPDKMIIERFGLNKEDIDKYVLSWIENLKTGSGKESYDYNYIQKYGERKCESNALFKNDETLKIGEELCRKTIEKYYGEDARKRFQDKEEQSKTKLSEIYNDPVWQDFSDKIDELVDNLSLKELKEEEKTIPKAEAEKEVEVTIDNQHYGRCPKCGRSFNYDASDIGRLVRCRRCNLSMRLGQRI